MGVSVGTNGVSVYEHGDSYIPALLVWQSPSAITDWIHVAIVYQNKQPKLYINGQLVKTGLLSSKQFVYPSFNFTGYAYGTYQGYVDEMRIWKEARTQQQIKDNRYGAIAVPQTNLSGYWPLSASTGSTLVDISGNNRSVPLNSNTGRLTGNAGGNAYRYGFNGQEKSDEISGEGNSYTAEFWEYDPRIGRRWNRDPVITIWESPYASFHNNPIAFSDVNGDDAGDRAKDHVKKNKIGDYKIGELKSGRGVSLSWVDGSGNARSKQFLTQRSDISENSKDISGSQYQAMATIEGIKRGSFMVNAYKNAMIDDISIAGKTSYSPNGGYITDTEKKGADRFNMYVNNSVALNVDESQANEFMDYQTFIVRQLMVNFVNGTGAENYVFPTNGIISSQFWGSDILNEALAKFNRKETVEGEQISFGFKELAKDYSRSGTFYSITGFVGSGTITIKHTDKGVMISIFNITSLTSGDLFKNPKKDGNWPKSFIRNGQKRTPFGNISQTFNLFIPNSK